MERRVILEILLGIYRIDKKYRQNPNSRRLPGSRGKIRHIQRFSNFESNDSEFTSNINQDAESQCDQVLSKQLSFNSDYEEDIDAEEYNFEELQDNNFESLPSSAINEASNQGQVNKPSIQIQYNDSLDQRNGWHQSLYESKDTTTNQQAQHNQSSISQQIDTDSLQITVKDSETRQFYKQSDISTKKRQIDNNSVGSSSFKYNQKSGSLQYGELRPVNRELDFINRDIRPVNRESFISYKYQSNTYNDNGQRSEDRHLTVRRPDLQGQMISLKRQDSRVISNSQNETAYTMQTPQCIKKLSNSFGVCPNSLLSAFVQFNSGDELKIHNIGLIKKQALGMYMQNPFNLFNSEEMLDSQLLKLISEYIIQAYAYEYSVIRIQQSNILIKMQFIIKQLIEEFDIEREDEELLEQMIHNIINIDKKNQELRVKTIFCCNRVMIGHSEKFLICNNCGKMCNFQKKSIRKDRNEGSQRNTSYHSIRHFDDVFKQLFIQPIEPIDSITKLQLQDFMNRDHKQKVTIEDVRQYLKQLPGGKGSKLNKSDAFIMGLLNGETLKITATEYQFIKNTFQQFIQVLYKNTDIRKNTPNCVSFIKNIIDLLYKDIDTQRHLQIVKRLHQQKENTTRKMQKTWQFIISQFDIQAIKQDFKNTIKKQGY